MISVVVNPELENIIFLPAIDRIRSFASDAAWQSSIDTARVRRKKKGGFSSGFFVLVI